ncbi:MAG TPA: cell division protein ZapE [Alphaproteobacteria bacterium]|nr:cell division protein ZapE [Alphaproteobacteria bacterium]
MSPPEPRDARPPPMILPASPRGPLSAYRDLRAAGKLNPDPAQLLAAEKLQGLANALQRYRPARNGNGWKRHLGLGARHDAAPQGLYLCGDAGRGKSMLMDLFFAHASVPRKRRVHFHAFMVEVHERIHRFRRGAKGDPIAPLAEELAEEAWLLCFDEFQVTDIADAMILGRLFQALFAAGVVIVATSNFAPDELYEDGLQRELFLPFIALIKEKLDVLHLEGGVDWRRQRLRGMRTYLTPLGAEASAALRAAFAALTDGAAGAPDQLIVQGRRLTFRHAAMGVLDTTFAELCQAPLGPADYLALAQHYRAVVLDGIPRLGPERRNEGRRLVTLIDELYEHRVQLIASAEVEPDQICPEGEVAALFRRTASRLIEMQTAEYLALAHLT